MTAYPSVMTYLVVVFYTLCLSSVIHKLWIPRPRSTNNSMARLGIENLARKIWRFAPLAFLSHLASLIITIVALDNNAISRYVFAASELTALTETAFFCLFSYLHNFGRALPRKQWQYLYWVLLAIVGFSRIIALVVLEIVKKKTPNVLLYPHLDEVRLYILSCSFSAQSGVMLMNSYSMARWAADTPYLKQQLWYGALGSLLCFLACVSVLILQFTLRIHTTLWLLMQAASFALNRAPLEIFRSVTRNLADDEQASALELHSFASGEALGSSGQSRL